MAYKNELARLNITPCAVFSDIKKRTIKLIQQGDQCFIEEIIYQKESRKHRKFPIPLSEVKQRVTKLRKVKVPAFPVSPDVLDGQYVELTVHGEFSTLTLGWWTIPPEGADGIGQFVEWLKSKITHDEQNSFD